MGSIRDSWWKNNEMAKILFEFGKPRVQLPVS